MPRSPNRVVGLVLGLAHLVLGGIGFAYAAGVEFAGNHGGLVLGLIQVNGLHNLVHLGVGAVLLAGVIAGDKWSRRVNAGMSTLLLLFGLWGLFLIGAEFNPIALNAAGNVVHLASSVLLLAAGLGAGRRAPLD